jgi:hypothetical protein
MTIFGKITSLFPRWSRSLRTAQNKAQRGGLATFLSWLVKLIYVMHCWRQSFSHAL